MTVHRHRTIVAALLVTAVAVRVSAPRPAVGTFARVADDPGRTLSDALQGWSAAGDLGGATADGLRDLPVATLAWLTQLIGVPVDVAAVAVHAGVLLLALVGALRLACAVLGVDHRRADPGQVTPWTPWIGAILYACGPVLLATTVGAPGAGLALAVMPWLLTPLVRGDTGWRAAARSAWWLAPAGFAGPWWAAAVLVAGAVAVACGALEERSRRGQALRWIPLALLASAWWLALVWWESTYVADVGGLLPDTSPLGILRTAVGSPTWGAFWVVVAALGPLTVAVAGLVLPLGRVRPLVGGLLVPPVAGGALLLAGWAPWAPAPLPTEPTAQPWSPLLGLVALAGLVAWVPVVEHVTGLLPVWGDQDPGRAAIVLGGVVVVLAAGAGPVLAAQEPVAPEDATDHAVWAGVRTWSENDAPGRILVAPAVAQGRESEVVARALADRPWVGRDALPASGPEGTAALDDLYRRLERGHADPGTASALRRLGVSYVLVRNDLGLASDRERPAGLVRHALDGLGASRIAVVAPTGENPEGAEDGEGTDDTATLVDAGTRGTTGGIEVWALPTSADGWVHPGTPVPVMGDASAASDLAAAGWIPDAAVRLVPAESEDAVVVADGARRWNVDQRVAVDPYGPVLTEGETRTVVPPGAAPAPTAARLLGGVRGVRASSSAADLGGDLRRAGADATAAVDANAFTSWRSRRGTLVGQWWEIELDGPTDLTLATAQLVESVFSDHRVTQVRVITDAGATEVDVPPGGLVSLAPAGVTERLRIEASAVTGTVGPDDSFGIVEVAVPGVVVRDQLEVRGSPTSTWLLAARPGSYATCVPAHPSDEPDEAAAPSATSCDPGLQVEGPDSGPIQRVLPVERPTPITGTAWVRAASSATAGRLADRLGAPTISAVGSSVAAQDLVTRPQAAADGDPSTAWRPSPEDESPDLRLTWRRPTAVTGLRLVEAEGTVSSRITQIRVTPGEGGEPVVADVPEGGVVDVPRTLTGRLDIEVLRDSGLSSVDSVTGGLRHVPIALAEIEVVGGPAVRFDHDREERLPCGSGPGVTIAGEPVPTAVTASARGVVDSESLPARLCSPPGLPAGDVDVEVDATFAWVPLGMALSPPDAASGPVATAAGTTETPTPLPSGLVGAATTHHLAIEAGGVRTLALAVPAGTGWAAHTEGRALEPVVLDGWMQGWVLPSGTDRVTLTYSASVLLRVAVGVASLGWLTVLVVALVPGSFLSRTRGYLRRAQSMAGRSTQT